jgi:hypothetical protein
MNFLQHCTGHKTGRHTMSYAFPRAKNTMLYACIIVSEILLVTAFNPNFLALQRLCNPATNKLLRISGRLRMVGDNIDLADMEAERMNAILELQRQTSYMNRFTTSSYLNKIQYDMAVNVNVTPLRAVEEKKQEARWNILTSIKKKLKKLAGNALDLAFASIFFMSREGKPGNAAVKKSSFPIFHKALLASQAIGSKLRCFIISIISMGQTFYKSKNSKSGPRVDGGPS